MVFLVAFYIHYNVPDYFPGKIELHYDLVTIVFKLPFGYYSISQGDLVFSKLYAWLCL